MKTVGVVGIGDMGSGLAKNLIKAGFSVRGYDLKPVRMADFAGHSPCRQSRCAGPGLA